MFGSPSGQDFSRIFVGNYDFLKFREALNALFIPGLPQKNVRSKVERKNGTTSSYQ